MVLDESRHVALAWRTIGWASSRNETLAEELAQVVALHKRRADEPDVFRELIDRLAAHSIGNIDAQPEEIVTGFVMMI